MRVQVRDTMNQKVLATGGFSGPENRGSTHNREKYQPQQQQDQTEAVCFVSLGGGWCVLLLSFSSELLQYDDGRERHEDVKHKKCVHSRAVSRPFLCFKTSHFGVKKDEFLNF